MNSRSFDNWTRTHATTANRRSLLGWSLTAGLATALSRLQPTAAQFGNGGSCTLAVTLTSSLPGGGSTSGTLVLDIGDGGAIITGDAAMAQTLRALRRFGVESAVVAESGPVRSPRTKWITLSL